MSNPGDVHFGVDATLFGRLSNINGNDSVNFYDSGEGEFAQDWLQNAMGYTLQRSVSMRRVQHGESRDHGPRDAVYSGRPGSRRVVAASHLRPGPAHLVWERSFDANGDFAGASCTVPPVPRRLGRSIATSTDGVRGDCRAAGRPQVLLVQSVTASVWDADAYGDCLRKLFTAFSFTGLKPGFVTEPVGGGMVPAAPVVCVPAISHFSDAALATLRKFKGRLVFVGNGDAMTHDEYGRARSRGLHGEKIGFTRGVASAEDLWTQILAKLPSWNFVSRRGVCAGRTKNRCGA